MRLVLIQGNMCAVYEGRKQLAIYEGASELDTESVEILRRAKIDT